MNCSSKNENCLFRNIGTARMFSGGGVEIYLTYKIMFQEIKTFLLIALEYLGGKIFFKMPPISALVFLIYL
jgi:hypothetical protein